MTFPTFPPTPGQRLAAALVLALGLLPALRSSDDLPPMPEPRALPDPTPTLRGNPSRSPPVYYPPVPPALGDPLPAAASGQPGTAPPALLASYVYEPFYAPLSSLLRTDFDRRRSALLDAYRLARTSALAALQARLASLQPAGSAARQQALAAFAAEQAPALAALEDMAEDLRHQCVRGGFFESASDWTLPGQLSSRSNARRSPAARESRTLAGAAFFQAGLSPAQRRLLRELSMELAEAAAAGSDLAPSLDAPGPFLYFAPEMARLRLPARMPVELREAIDRYQRLKVDLKRELREAVQLQQERMAFEFARVAAFRKLAAHQAARLANLEQMAEAIRVGLAPLPNPAKPPDLPFSRDLSDRIFSHLVRKAEWERLTRDRLAALRREFPGARPEIVRHDAGFTIRVVSTHRAAVEADAERQLVLASLAGFTATQNESYAALNQEADVLRAEVSRVLSLTRASGPGKSAAASLEEFSPLMLRQQQWARYHDYALAVLEPGLSAAQRRLLFGAAVEKLSLPLVPPF